MAVYEYDSQNDELKRIAGGTLFADLPIGFILPSFESIAPQGFLKMTDTLANRTVSRTTYKELFDWATERDLIGTGKPFGVGDGSTTFVIPDGKEIAFKGIGEYEGTVGAHVKSGGLAVGEFIDDRVQNLQFNISPEGPAANSFVYGSNTAGVTSLSSVCKSSARLGATTEVKSLGCHYYIKAKNVGVPADFVSAIDDVIGDKLSYSITEINTGKKWIDGKPIYSKTVDTGGMPNNTSKSVAHGISNIGKIIKYEGFATGNGLTTLSLPYVGTASNQTDKISVYVGPTNIGIVTAQNMTDFTISYLTIEYTKTTD